MTQSIPLRRSRVRLFAGTALAGLAAVPGAAWGANLPTGGNVAFGTVNGYSTTSPTGASIPDATGPNLGLTVSTPKAIINWNTFDVGTAANTVTFTNGNSGGGAYSVLNRVTGGGASLIAGKLTSNDALATIWLVNPAGITVSGSGRITNIQNFIGSALGVTDAMFEGSDNTTDGTYEFLTGSGTIDVQPGAKISTGASLVLVAPKITIEPGATTALTAGSDVGFVVAQDATVQLGGNSIVKVGLKSGTTVGAGAETVGAGATVSGQKVVLAALSQGTVTDALLQIDGAISATSTTAGLVITSGQAASAGTGTTGLSVTVPNTTTISAAEIGGTLKSDGPIAIAGSGITFTGASARAQLGISVTSVGAYDIHSSGGSSLVANTKPAGGGSNAELLLSSGQAITGDLSVDALGTTTSGSTTTTPGSGRVRVSLSDTSNAVSLGNVTGTTLIEGNGGIGDNNFHIAGALRFGDIKTSSPVDIDSTGNALTIGSVVTDNDTGTASVTLASHGPLMLGGTGTISKSGGPDALTGLVVPAFSVNSDAAVTISGGPAGGGGVTSQRGVTITAGTTLTFDNKPTITSGGSSGITITTGGAILKSGSGSGNLAAGTGNVEINLPAGSAVTLGDVTANQLERFKVVALVSQPYDTSGHFDTDANITLGDVTLTQPVAVQTSNGTLTVGSATSTGGAVTLESTGLLTFGGTAKASTTPAGSSFSLTSDNAGVTLEGLSGSPAGSVAITSGAGLTITAATDITSDAAASGFVIASDSNNPAMTKSGLALTARGGSIDAGQVSLWGGTDGTTALGDAPVTLTVGATGSITLADIVASGLATKVPSGTGGGSQPIHGPISIGNITTSDPIDLETDGGTIEVGSVVSTANTVTLATTGSTANSISLGVGVAKASSSVGDFTISTAGATVTAGNEIDAKDATPSPASASISITTGSTAANVSTAALKARDAVTVSANDFKLGDVTAGDDIIIVGTGNGSGFYPAPAAASSYQESTGALTAHAVTHTAEAHGAPGYSTTVNGVPESDLAGSNVIVQASNAKLVVGGNVTSDRDIRLTATTQTFGNASQAASATANTMAAGRSLALVATTGDLTFQGTPTLNSDVNGTTATATPAVGGLTLSSAGGILEVSPVAGTTGATLIGGKLAAGAATGTYSTTATTIPIQIQVANGKTVTLGDITGGQLVSGTYDPVARTFTQAQLSDSLGTNRSGGLFSSGLIALGHVTTNLALDVETTLAPSTAGTVALSIANAMSGRSVLLRTSAANAGLTLGNTDTTDTVASASGYGADPALAATYDFTVLSGATSPILIEHAITAQRDLRIDGSQVKVDLTGRTDPLQAQNDILVRTTDATTGDIVFAGRPTLKADTVPAHDTSPDGATLTLDSARGIVAAGGAGDPGASLIDGTGVLGKSGAIQLRVADAQPITLDGISGYSLRSVTGSFETTYSPSGAPDTIPEDPSGTRQGLFTTGAITLGDVKTFASLDIETTADASNALHPLSIGSAVSSGGASSSYPTTDSIGWVLLRTAGGPLRLGDTTPSTSAGDFVLRTTQAPVTVTADISAGRDLGIYTSIDSPDTAAVTANGVTLSAARDVTVRSSHFLLGTVTAGDDITLAANAIGAASSVVNLTTNGTANRDTHVHGYQPDGAGPIAATAAPDPDGSDDLPNSVSGGSNILVTAADKISITGTVASAGAYHVAGATVVLGAAGSAFDQHADGDIAVTTSYDPAAIGSYYDVATSPSPPLAPTAANLGTITLAGTAGSLKSDANGDTATGNLVLTAQRGISSTVIGIDAATVTGAAVAQQPFVKVSVATASAAQATDEVTGHAGGTVSLASIHSGGAVTVSAPASMAVGRIDAGGPVTMTGFAQTGQTNDTATITGLSGAASDPVLVTIDHLDIAGTDAGEAITLSAGGGVTAAANVVNQGKIGALGLYADTGVAYLVGAPNLTGASETDSILVESQTGNAKLLTAPTDQVTAGTITVAVRQYAHGTSAGAGDGTASILGIATATGGAGADPAILVTGPKVFGRSLSATSGDIVLVGDRDTGSGNGAELDAGDARSGSLIVTSNGATRVGDVSAGGDVIASGADTTVSSSAVAGDDLVLLASGLLDVHGATTLRAGFNTSAGTNSPASVTLGSTPLPLLHDYSPVSENPGLDTGTNHYAVAHGGVLGTKGFALDSSVTGKPLADLDSGANAVLSAGTVLATGSTLHTGTGDARIEAVGTIDLGEIEAGRTLTVVADANRIASIAPGQTVVAAQPGSTITLHDDLKANDDLLLVTSGNVAGGTYALTAGAAGATDLQNSDATAAVLADGSTMGDPTSTAAAGAIVGLLGHNIVVAAGGTADVASATTLAAGRDVRIAALDATTVGTVQAGRDATLIGASVEATGDVRAGDDVIVAARAGAAKLTTIETLATAADNETDDTTVATDLSGNPLAAGTSPLHYLDGSSISIAATSTATVSGAVQSLGRYTVIGRSPGAGTSAVTLGDAAQTGIVQTANRTIRIEAWNDTGAATSDITLAGDLKLTSNADSAGPADGITLALAGGDINAGAATITTRATPDPTGAGDAPVVQGAVITSDLGTGSVHKVTIATLDAPTATIVGDGAVTVTSATFDGVMTLASRHDAVMLTNAAVAQSGDPAYVAHLDAADAAGIDLRLFGTTGAMLGQTATASDGLLRDVIVSTSSGTATITRAAAHDDIVASSASGGASITTALLVGTPSDAQGDAATTLARFPSGSGTVADPYGYSATSGTTLSGLNGANIVVTGQTGATLTTADVQIAANSVRVETVNGTAHLETLSDTAAPATTDNPALAFVASRNGQATAQTVNAGEIQVVGATRASLALGNTDGNITVHATGTGGDASLAEGHAASGTILVQSDAANANADTVTAGGDIDVSAAGAASAGGAVAGGSITVDGGTTATLTHGRAGADIDVEGGSGTALAVYADAGRSLTVHSQGSDATLTEGYTRGASTSADILVRSDGGVATATLAKAARDLRVVATGAATATNAGAGRDIFVTAGGDTATLTQGTAVRDVTVDGPSVVLGTVTGGDDIVAVASAGTLTATSLATQAPLSDSEAGSNTVAALDANTSAIIDPTANPAAPVTGLAGSQIVLLAKGAVSAGTTNSAGGVRIASAVGISTGDTSAKSGDLAMAGTSVTGGNLSATGAATLIATAGDISLTSLAAGGIATLDASHDVHVAQTLTAGAATIDAGHDIVMSDLAPAGTKAGFTTTAGDATLDAGNAITVTQASDIAGALGATSGAGQSFGAVTTGGATTLAANGGDLVLASLAAGGSAALAASHDVHVAGTTSASDATVEAGNAITLGDAVAPGATGLTITAGDAALTAGDAITVTQASNVAGTLTATSGAGQSFGAVTTGGAATLAANGGDLVLASLAAGGSVALNASHDVHIAGTTSAADATIKAGNAITLSDTAAAGATGFATTKGDATLNAGTAIAITQASSIKGALTATSGTGQGYGAVTTGGAATFTAGQALTAGATQVGGALTATAGAAMTFASIDVASASLTAQGLLKITGDAVTSGPAGAFAATSSADSVAIGGKLQTTGDATLAAKAGAITVGTAGAGNAHATKNLTLTAGNGVTVNGGAQIAGNYTVTAGKTITLTGPGATQQASGDVTLSSSDLVLGADQSNDLKLVAGGTAELQVTGAAVKRVAIGDGVSGSDAPYALSASELSRIGATNLEITTDNADNASRIVDIGGAVVPATVTGAFAINAHGDVAFGSAPTNAANGTPIDAGAFKVTSTPLVVIGGNLKSVDANGHDLGGAGASTIRVMPTSALNNSAGTGGGQVLAPNSRVVLRGEYIALGQVPVSGRAFLSDLLPTNTSQGALGIDQVRTAYFGNPNSTLYTPNPPFTVQTPGPQAILEAKAFTLTAGKWALVQNTGITQTMLGGVKVGSDDVQFYRLDSTDPLIALFGSIDGFNGVVAPVKVTYANLNGISPSNIRINGCFALQSASCILTGVELPIVNVADPSAQLVIANTTELALPIEIVTGASNELLWNNDDDSDNRDERPHFDPTAPGVSTTDVPAGQPATEKP